MGERHRALQQGTDEVPARISQRRRDVLDLYIEALNRITQIANRDFNSEKITGAGKTVDEVVDIFNKVNSGGTKLSKGDLALAKLCAEWPDARKELRDNLDRWQKAGFRFSLDWLLRNATAVATGRALFSSSPTCPPPISSRPSASR